MKRIFAAVLASVLAMTGVAALAAAANAPETTWSWVRSPLDEKTANDGKVATIALDKKSYPLGTENVTVTIKNKSKARLVFGAEYYIEKMHPSGWYRLMPNGDLDWPMWGEDVRPGKTGTHTYGLGNLQEAGQYRFVYRIIKNVGEYQW